MLNSIWPPPKLGAKTWNEIQRFKRNRSISHVSPKKIALSFNAALTPIAIEQKRRW